MYIPNFLWEERFSSLVGLTVNQFRFLLSLYLSVPLSLGPRFIRSWLGRHLYAIVVGILLLAYPFGTDCWRSLVPSLVSYLSFMLCPKKCSYVAWGVIFPFLVMQHVLNASGDSWKEGKTDFTGAEMLLTLKLISLAHCIQDSHTGKELQGYQKAKAVYNCPSLLEFLSYVFSVGGLLAGPHFEFKDYQDYMDRKGVWAKSVPFSSWAILRPALQAMLCMAAYVQLSPKFNFRIYSSVEYEQMELWYRYWTTWITSFTDRAKYYHVWSIAEINTNISGFGCDGPAQGKNGLLTYEWKRGQNVRPFEVEFADSFTLIATHWNISTGNFLRRYVYDRLSSQGKKPSFLILLATQLVSGVWHGLYPGYWLFFFSTAICVFTSRVIYKYTRLLGKTAYSILRIPLLFFTTITLAYMATAFQVLDLWDCIYVWKKLYFLPHIICVGICVIGTIIPPPKSRLKSS